MKAEITVPNSVITEEAEPLSWKFWKKRRYIVVFLAFLGYLSSYSLRVNLSVAIVAMTDEESVSVSSKNQRYFDWQSNERGVIFSSFYWAYILTQFLGGILAKKYGGNLILGIGIGIPAVLSLLTPFLVTSLKAMVVIRFLQGFFAGMTFPCIQDIWLYWAPIPERSRMTSITYSGMFIGTVVTMPISAQLASDAGWESIFYLFGAFGILWHIVWVIFVRSAPHRDPFISKDELQYIQSKVSVEKKGKRVIPWKALLTSKAVYGITAAQFAVNWGFNTMIAQLPTFLSDMHGYNLESSGALSAVPYLTMGILASLAGYVADILINKQILTISEARKYFVCCSLLVQTACMVTAGVVFHPVWSVILIVIGVGAGGVTTSGFSVNALDIAPDYASVILGFSNTFSCLTGIISPIITGNLLQNQPVDGWQIVFYIIGGMYVAGCVVYWFWSSGELQSWSQTEKNVSDQKDENKDEMNVV